MRSFGRAVLLMVLLGLSACTTLRETQPTQTARHQLLLSAAADNAVAQVDPNLPAGTRIYIDDSRYTVAGEYHGAYLLGALEAALLKRGYGIASDAETADTILGVSSGALSIDRRERLFGIPSATLPIPLAGPLNTPEIAFYKSNDRTGIAKLRLNFYDAATGMAQSVGDPITGRSYYDRSSILFFGRTRTDIDPLQGKPRPKGR